MRLLPPEPSPRARGRWLDGGTGVCLMHSPALGHCPRTWGSWLDGEGGPDRVRAQ